MTRSHAILRSGVNLSRVFASPEESRCQALEDDLLVTRCKLGERGAFDDLIERLQVPSTIVKGGCSPPHDHDHIKE